MRRAQLYSLVMAPLLIVAAGMLAYCNSYQGVFLLDDHPMIVDNPSIRQLNPITKFLFEGGVRRLPMLSFAMNYAVGGLETTTYHYFNVAVHLLAALSLYGLLIVTFRSSVWLQTQRTEGPLLAFCVSLLWVVHPLNSQAVNYLVQRIESMMGLAFFLFLFIYALASVEGKRTWPRVTLFALAWLVFCVGLACKEVMVMSLPVALLYDRAFIHKNWRDSIRTSGWFWLACALPLGVAAIFIVPAMLGSEGAVGLSLKSITPMQYLATQPEVILHYLRLAVFPSPLVFDYGWEPETNAGTIAVTGGLLVASVLGLIGLYTRKPHLAFWGLAIALVLLPTSSFIPLQDLAVEHRMYVPLSFVITIAVLVLFSFASKFLGDHPRAIASTACVALSGVLAMMTITRSEDYKSAIVMWEDVIAKTTEEGAKNVLAGRAYSNLGEAYGDQQQWDKSIDSLERALQCRQFLPNVHGNLARAYIATGKADLAKKHCSIALEMSPDSARLNQQAGLIEVMQKNFEAAAEHFEKAYNLAPEDSVIVLNLAQCRLQLGDREKALSLLMKAISMDAKAAEPRVRLVELLMQDGKVDEAVEAAQEFEEAMPGHPRANLLLGMLSSAKGDQNRAAEHLQRAADSDPPPPEANFLLGNHHRAKSNLAAARRCYEAEIKHYPKNVDALNRLAEIVAGENPQLASGYFQRVIELAPRAWQARYNMASLQAMLGNKAMAKLQLEAVLEINPDCEPATRLLRSLE